MPISTIEPTSALLLVDLQKGVTGSAGMPIPLSTVLANAAELAAAFRAKNLPVVLINVDGVTPGRTDVSLARGAGDARERPDNWAELADELDAQPTDHRVTKSGWGAFHNTGLDARLRALGVTQVVLGGVATSMGVESTARAAREHGYDVVIATDAITDRSADAHHNSVTRIFPRIAETGTTADVLALLG
ncbi:isochorismatase family protein [Glaciihabitans sp. dw_435]|uniref:isochorismatase family protein n=1 Tax=Glaciihabitans sp. dw_435 TaxID=2720081 RepID=UPI001BD29419|nr:isochorismatase family protein [Glaciihabitans sp. dw_435]